MDTGGVGGGRTPQTLPDGVAECASTGEERLEDTIGKGVTDIGSLDKKALNVDGGPAMALATAVLVSTDVCLASFPDTIFVHASNWGGSTILTPHCVGAGGVTLSGVENG